ncbi:cation diffusion facilitator family transporter [Nitrosomonas sp. Nm51]|uniref:cation diffusion facilitator family transporter n=1 Tax=Nitrosomonas sp. Nm51 TaxID=133720 RepID=UPI0008D61B86|nr:cation diffusion facilitator family transporter [Nitrosomonas sp. Nm51]SER50475.1 cation diffusion facilitator family transporter [Nitrosomonas sp. Nm51]
MYSDTDISARQQRYQDVRKVTLVGFAVDFFLGVVKVITGWLANSQALIADGIHSFSDVFTDFFVLYAAKHAHKAADERHPYGHGRIETLATVALGIVLVAVACGVAYDSILRLNQSADISVPGNLALAVAIVAIISKEAIYRYTVAAARRLRSDLLMANAWHSRSDAISSIVVMLGIVGAMYGQPYLDSVAAVVVAVMIAKIGFDLVRSSSLELIDTALGREEVNAIRKHIFEVKGVRSMHMLRSRKSAGNAIIDVHIQVDPLLSVSEGHQIGDTVRRRLLDAIDVVSDVTVHIDPEDDESGSPCDDLPNREHVIKALKQCWPHLPASAIEQVTLHYLSGEIQIELDLPLSILHNIQEASKLVNQLRSDCVLPYVSDIQVRLKV